MFSPRMRRWHVIQIVALVTCASGPSASARGQLADVGAYSGRLVYIERADGPLLRAVVLAANEAELLVSVGDDELRLSKNQIRKISTARRSPRRKWFLIGAAAGVPIGVFGCQGSRSSDCPVVISASLGAIVFGTVGAILAGDERLTVVYRATP